MMENLKSDSNVARERAEIDRRFRSLRHTIDNVQGDFSPWHKGRTRYLLWAIDVDGDAVRGQVASAGLHLHDLLLSAYRRQPHITLALCGFASGAPQRFDDVGRLQIDAQMAALRQARPQSFSIDIGHLTSFSSAPFLHVVDADDGIAGLRLCLGPPGFDHGPDDYIAHVTVGLYQGAWPSAAVSHRLSAFASRPAVRHRVDRISLMSYAAHDISGPLTTIAAYHFDSAAIVWHEEAPF